ncbi:MAG: efflux RND transporter permease subunit [Myxococcales bacterium]|nr:efflux RND transporter permease subunit [Myxococcales bacterium]
MSLRHRALVLFGAAALLVVGSYRTLHIPIDVFPDLTAPRVTIATESSGMAAEEVERLVTYPIEAAVHGTAGLRRVRSASAPGISVVWAEFDWDTSQTVARQRVTERLQGVTDSLPPEADAPLLMPASSVMGEIAFIALTGERRSPIELRRIAEVDVRRRLLAVEGVSQVVPIGGHVKQYQVLVDPFRLESLGLTLAHVVEALRRGSRNAPGGYVTEGGLESVIRVLGRALSVNDLAAIVITRREDVPIHVRDVADVRVGPAVARGAASYNAESAVLLSVVKQPGADTVSTTGRLDAALAELSPQLAKRGVTVHTDVFRQQTFIDTAIANVMKVLRDGSLLVVGVLLLFLWSLRPTLISAIALPLSLMFAVLVLDLAGLTIDTMTLGGLAIAIGELVDDAIVDVENVARRLRQRAALPEHERPPILTTVLQASLEVRAAIASATYILMLVFVPLLLLEGLEGRLLRPLAIAYLSAIFASLIVAVTVTPVLCSLLLARATAATSQADPPVIRWLTRGYVPILKGALAHPWLVLSSAAVVVAGGAFGLMDLGRAFLPPFNEGSLTINMVLAPGTPLSESNALATMAERALLKDPAVLSVGRRTGRAERDEHVLGVETTEMEVRLKRDDPRTREQVFSDIRERLKVVPARFHLGQPISHRIEHMISGQRAALAIKIFGGDLRALRRTGEAVRSAIEGIPGIVDVNVEQIVDIPQLTIRVDAQAASAYGLSAGEAASAIGAALWGTKAAHVYEQGTTTPVVVRYPDALTSDPRAVRRLRIATPAGALVPLSALAEVRRDAGPNYILRENVARRLIVSANVAGQDVRGAYEHVRNVVAQTIQPTDGTRIEYAGQFERQAATQQRLLIFGALALFAVGIIVAVTLRSARRALFVLMNMPLALAGGIAGVYLAGGVLSVATTIGFITLFGIATRNGVLLSTRARDLELAGCGRQQAVQQAATERLAPITMTAVTAALGLLPLAMALGQPGSEIQAPMALVILTGLVTSTILNMLVVPVLLSRWGGSPGGEARP